MEKELEVGSVYWIQINLDVGTDEQRINRPTQARYMGDGGWQFDGENTLIEWPVSWVGEKVNNG